MASPTKYKYAFLVPAALLGATFAYGEGDLFGIWQTQAGDARVQVSKRGEGSCGTNSAGDSPSRQTRYNWLEQLAALKAPN